MAGKEPGVYRQFKPVTFACWHCGHKDNRDASHARGCPRLPAVSKAELMRIARQVEAGWDIANRAEAELKAAKA